MLTESAPVFRAPLLKTPFHDRARALCEVDSFIPWAGYTTVDVFSAVEPEYFAIRNAASLYDLSPMVKYRISGPDAARYLNRLVTRDIGRVRPGRVVYCIWCNDAGEIIDDGTLFRFGTDEFRLCTAERQLDWLLDSAIGFQVEVSEVTTELAALALQGPTSWAILRDAGLPATQRLKPFDAALFDWPGLEPGAREVLISRTGFTADLGYELWIAPPAAESVWDTLMRAGAGHGLRPIGSRALNIARIEAGFLQPNVDFVSAERVVRVGTARTPFELGLDWLLDFGKGHFNGRRALLVEQRRGPRRRLLGLDIEGTKPAHNALLYRDRKARTTVGSVTSATWSPTCKRNIAFAMIEAPHFAAADPLWAEIYLNRELTWERRMARARIAPRAFFDPERRRATPPRAH